MKKLYELFYIIMLKKPDKSLHDLFEKINLIKYKQN